MFIELQTKEELQLKANVERELVRAVELARELCRVFEMKYRVKGWSHSEYVIELVRDRYDNNFEIRTNGTTTYFADCTRTGVGTYRNRGFLPSELQIDPEQANSPEYRNAWVARAKSLLGVTPSFCGNSGFGPHIYMKFPVTEQYARNIMDLLKAQGVKLRIGGVR